MRHFFCTFALLNVLYLSRVNIYALDAIVITLWLRM
jgi:hypothetical protein